MGLFSFLRHEPVMSAAPGARAEDLAAEFLQRRGLKLLERNHRCRGGEVDLVCRDGDTVVFVEVRLRSDAEHGGAAASITPAKRRRLIQAARHWLSGKPECPCRFDAVLMDRPAPEAIEWVKGAFDAD
ncbi:MAG: YraN family protein [Rhodocyclaceae bacterium]|nr:YraN family protein [Rhodocyclaceae bacterium]